MNMMTTQQNSSIDDTSRIVEPAAWMAILATSAAIVFLAALHVLSPEFSPSWRMISEYAFGHYAWLLSLMFLSWGLGTWALVNCHLLSGPHQRGKGRNDVPDRRRSW